MFKIGIIGPESTGKTMLAQYLAERYNGVFVPEYAREYMENLHRPYTYEDVETIARKQIEQLQNRTGAAGLTAKRSNSEAVQQEQPVFFDTELIITKVWFEHKYNKCPEWLLEALHRYPMDVYLLCYPDIAWEPDPVRENPDIRLELFQRYEAEIQALNIPYYIIRHSNTLSAARSDGNTVCRSSACG